MNANYRLITRCDFDGIVCAMMLKEMNLIKDIMFVHPKDVQDGLVDITSRDIMTNLPYSSNAKLVFDHHLSEEERLSETRPENSVLDPLVKSSARVVFDYYGGEEKFSDKWNEILKAVDKADSASFSIEEILKPKKWVLLNYILDPRTGLGRFKNFRLSHFDFAMSLIDFAKNHSIDEILENPDVKERVDLYFEQTEQFKSQIKRCAKKFGNLVLIDLRNEEIIYAGNRFLVYALFPECNISMHCIWGVNKQNTVFAIGKSIVNKTSRTNVGLLALNYGGGGHENAGTCQIPNEQAFEVMQKLIHKINFDG